MGEVELPVAPAHASADAVRVAPTITTLDEASRALEAGFYREVATALARMPGTPSRALVEARLALVTGRYDDAARLAEVASADAPRRLEAVTLHAEALIARGRLDDAEARLRAIAGDGSAHRARVVLGRLLVRRGRADDARPFLMRLVEDYNDERIAADDAAGLCLVAMAAQTLGSVRDANDAFTESARIDGARVETQLEWARLFFTKNDFGHAGESLDAVFATNPEEPRARALRARILLEQSFDVPGAEADVARALAVNPNVVEAFFVRASIAIRDLDDARATREIDRALAVDPTDLAILATRAALRFVRGDVAGFAASEREILALNARYAELYAIVASHAEWEHRYPDIIRLARESIRVDARDARGYALLGHNLLREGDEPAGIAALQDAWRRDRYDVQVYNTLNFYEDVITPSYERFEAAPITYRMHREERPFLEPVLPPLLAEGYASMVRRYGITPRGPVVFELFASADHFSVRTSGLPNLGVQGVCFGRVVTAISPRGGAFDVGEITWHELAHVFHIQLSNNRVPRWFTEGLAEHETRIARPYWRREMDHDLHAALVAGRIPTLARMNEAFTHADSQASVITAYYAASRIVGYIAARFGFEKIVRMLVLFGQDHSIEDVALEALGVSVETLDADFREAMRTELARFDGRFEGDLSAYTDLDDWKARAAAAPADLDVLAGLAAAFHIAEEDADAMSRAERVVATVPAHPLARFVLARIEASRRSDAAETHLRAILAGGVDGYVVRLFLARVRIAKDDLAGARAELEAAVRLDPDRLEAYGGLREVAERTSDESLARTVRARLVAIDEHDRDALVGHVAALFAERKFAEIAELAPRVRLVAPESFPSRMALATAFVETRAFVDAELDARLARRLDATSGLAALLHARALAGRGQRAEARRVAAEAVALDASLADRAREIR